MHVLGVESTILTSTYSIKYIFIQVKRYKFAIKCDKDYFDIDIFFLNKKQLHCNDKKLNHEGRCNPFDQCN